MYQRHMSPVVRGSRHKAAASKVQVFVNLRQDRSPNIVKSSKTTVTTYPPDGQESKTYEFSRVFTEQDDIRSIFDVVCKPSLDSFIDAQKDGLIFTYGVTGAGKTYMMEGPNDDGLIYHTFDYIFDKIKEDEDSYKITLSIIELYGDELRDLLSADKERRLKIQSNSRMRGETRIDIRTAGQASKIYKKAKSRRTTLETNCNDASSRGHLVLSVGLQKTSDEGTKFAQMCLVDLAGSERTKKSGVSGSGMEESKHINSSLFVLRKCLMDLKDHKFPYSYRDSNLTKLFKSYFDGIGAVTLILCVNPQRDNFIMNLDAMQFGTQTRNVKVDYASPPKLLKRDGQQIEPFIRISREGYNLSESYKEDNEKFRIIMEQFASFRKNLVRLFDENENLKSQTKKRIRPSAPMESSPTITTDSSTTSNIMEYREQLNHSPLKETYLPTQDSSSGVPVINPRHNRSLYRSSLQWIHHKPAGTIDTGTVLRPKLRNGRSVKNLRSSDILRPDTGGYSVLHQVADTNGDVETKVYKGHILSTVCGGAQVVLHDVETMKQTSPSPKRRASCI